MIDIQQTWKEQFPELYAAMWAGQTRREVLAIGKKIARQYFDEDSLPYPACAGAILQFKKDRLAEVTPECVVNRSAAEMRTDRILYTGATTQSGRRVARKF